MRPTPSLMPWRTSEVLDPKNWGRMYASCCYLNILKQRIPLWSFDPHPSPSTYPMHPNLPFHHTSHWNRELRWLWVRWNTFVFCKESCWHGYSHLLLPIKVTYFECLNALFSKKRYCSSLCAWHSSKVLQVLYKKLSCRLLSSGPLAKLLKLLEFY